MSSSTRRSSVGTKHRLTILLCVGVAFAATHLVLESAARFAERHLGAYLWKEQDYLRLFSPSNHVDRGRDRLLIYGPSEAREGLLPEEIARVTPGFEPYQNSQSIGTLEDGLVVLNYIERAYGRSATPDAILLGITTRFIGDIRTQPSPLFRGIDKYSPHFKIVEGTHPPGLAPKSALESARAHWDLLSLQPDRYRRGLFAIASGLATKAMPSLSAEPRIWMPIAPAKYLPGTPWPAEATKAWLVEPGNFWEAVHAWDPERDRERVTRELRMLLEYTSRHGIQLFVVNLPELSWNRDLYQPGRYEAYLAIVKTALGETPFLDLRTFLTDDEFFDDAHPNWTAGIRVSKHVATFIDEHRRHAQNTRGVR